MEHLQAAKNQMSEQYKSFALKTYMADRVECEICLENCLKDELKEHREMCMARLMFQCAICHGYYVSKEGLWNHLDLHEILDESKELHYQEIRATYKLHQCTLCNDQRGYQENVYWKHVHEDHDGFFLRCSECGESFRSKNLKTDHELNHCKAMEQMVAGGLQADQKLSNIVLTMQNENNGSLISCGEMIEYAAVKLEPSQKELNNVLGEDSKCSEIKMVDQLDSLVAEKINEDSNIDSRLSELTEKETAHTDCNEKDDVSSVQGELIMEIKVEESTMQEQEYQAQDEDRGKSPTITIISARQHKIRKTSRRTNLKKNCQETTHSKIPKQNVVCELCPRTFQDEDKLQQHIYSAHPCSECPCDMCNLKFSTRYQLMYHMRKDHTGLKYKCSHCPKMCYSQTNLNHHEITHSKIIERNVACKLCPRTFWDEYRLQRHVYSAHPPSELPCGKCDLKFSTRHKLFNHVRTTHTEPIHICSQCPKMCYTNRELNRHEATHSKILERKIVCKLCSRTFRDDYRLQQHVYSAHPTSELPCSVCDLKFSTRPKLYNHMKTIHKSTLRKHMDVQLKTTENQLSLDGSKRRRLGPSSDDSKGRRLKEKKFRTS